MASTSTRMLLNCSMVNAPTACDPAGSASPTAWDPSYRAGQLVMRPRARSVDLLGGCAQTVQDVLDEGEGDFTLSRVDAVRACFPQRLDVAQVRRACQHPNARIQLAR